ncbi:hypothetical protein KXW88_005438, partial [Aspergillus fumigatus]
MSDINGQGRPIKRKRDSSCSRAGSGNRDGDEKMKDPESHGQQLPKLCFGILPLFEHFNHTFSHLSEGFLKVAGSRFLLTTVMLKTAFLIGETRVGELQLMVFPLKARAVGMLRH